MDQHHRGRNLRRPLDEHSQSHQSPPPRHEINESPQVTELLEHACAAERETYLPISVRFDGIGTREVSE